MSYQPHQSEDLTLKPVAGSVPAQGEVMRMAKAWLAVHDAGQAHDYRTHADAAAAILRALVAASPCAAQPTGRVLPNPGSLEASAMLDSLLAEYQWPANTKNAARAGWEAANRWLTAAAAQGGQQPAPQESALPDQTILHAEGECGNCLQATIAGILGWPLESVPHFALLGEVHWWDCLESWLDSQGFWIDYKPDSYASEGGELLPRCWLSGPSPRGFSHAVVGDSATGAMLHDPHPSRAGLVQTDYTVYFFRKPRAAPAGPAAPPSEEITDAMLRAADAAFRARDGHAARVVYAGIYRAMRAAAAMAPAKESEHG